MSACCDHRGSIPFRGRGVPNPIPRFHGPRPTITDRLNAGSLIDRRTALHSLDVSTSPYPWRPHMRHAVCCYSGLHAIDLGSWYLDGASAPRPRSRVDRPLAPSLGARRYTVLQHSPPAPSDDWLTACVAQDRHRDPRSKIEIKNDAGLWPMLFQTLHSQTFPQTTNPCRKTGACAP